MEPFCKLPYLALKTTFKKAIIKRLAKHDYIVDQTFASNIWDKYGYKFSAANSINWGRLLPQVVYHASGYLDLVKQGEIDLGEPIDICVPTGNFGNILAAFYAKVQNPL